MKPTQPLTLKEYPSKFLSVQDLIRHHVNIESMYLVKEHMVPVPTATHYKKFKLTKASAIAFASDCVKAVMP